jgi:hypothetical protein
MNNARADMFHDLVCEHRKLSDAHSKLQLELSQKGNPPTYLAFLTSQFSSGRHILICRHISVVRHSAAGAEAQATALLERVKEMTGMPVSANLSISALVLQIL